MILAASAPLSSRRSPVPASSHAIDPPVPQWRPYFQVRTLAGYQPSPRGTFRYPEAFSRL